MQSKVDDLSRANDDMQNLLNSTEVATIFLDQAPHPPLHRAGNPDPSHPHGHRPPLADLVSSLAYRAFEDCREVLRTLVFRQIATREAAGT